MFANYGDVNFLDNGFLIEKQNDTEFRVLVCGPIYDSPGLYFFYDCFVCITDDWIDREAVESYSGITAEEDPAVYAEACISYYGPEEFGGYYYNSEYTEEEVREALNSYGVELAPGLIELEGVF